MARVSLESSSSAGELKNAGWPAEAGYAKWPSVESEESEEQEQEQPAEPDSTGQDEQQPAAADSLLAMPEFMTAEDDMRLLDALDHDEEELRQSIKRRLRGGELRGSEVPSCRPDRTGGDAGARWATHGTGLNRRGAEFDEKTALCARTPCVLGIRVRAASSS